VGTSERAYRSLLRAYPRELRDEYGDEMARCFKELCREELEDGGGLGLAALWARTLPELFYTALKERSTISNRNAYRLAVGVALAAAFILVWLSLGVGIIGADGDPANMMYFGVLAVGLIGAIVTRFRPHRMARALFATALAQALVAVIALIFGLGLPWSPPVEVLALNGFFVSLFVGSALLFRYAGREQTPAGAGQEG
jgi:hypothetical protein